MKENKYWNPPKSGEKQDDEVSCYTVAIGNLPIPPFIPKKSRQAIDYIQSLSGFVGFYPCYPKGTLCLFRTENQAKSARNLMQSKGIQTGRNIAEVYVNKMYLKGEK